MSEFFIKPAQENLIVRDPITRKLLAKEGESKPRNSYWLRRERDGDVVQTKKPPASKSESKPAKQEGDKS